MRADGGRYAHVVRSPGRFGVTAAAISAGAAFSTLGACAFDLDPYRASGPTGGGGSGPAVSAHASDSVTTPTAASGQSEATSSADGSTSSGGDLETPYPFCNESDPLDDSSNWNDGNQVEFGGGHVQLGPDNTFSYVTWHEDLEVQAPCVFTVRLESNLGAASFGLRKSGSNKLYVTIDGDMIQGPTATSPALPGEFPMTLAMVVTPDAIVSAFHDSRGWHRLDSIGKPPWLAEGLRPVMGKAGDDLYAVFDAYNTSVVFPSDVDGL